MLANRSNMPDPARALQQCWSGFGSMVCVVDVSRRVCHHYSCISPLNRAYMVSSCVVQVVGVGGSASRMVGQLWDSDTSGCLEMMILDTDVQVNKVLLRDKVPFSDESLMSQHPFLLLPEPCSTPCRLGSEQVTMDCSIQHHLAQHLPDNGISGMSGQSCNTTWTRANHV